MGKGEDRFGESLMEHVTFKKSPRVLVDGRSFRIVAATGEIIDYDEEGWFTMRATGVVWHTEDAVGNDWAGDIEIDIDDVLSVTVMQATFESRRP